MAPSSPDVVCFGEALLCYKMSDAGGRRGAADDYQRAVGGAELNTAVGLATLGRRVRLLTVLPETPLAKPISECLKAAKVDTQFVKTDSSSDAEIGVHHFIRGSVYQRLNSSFCRRIDISTFDWDAALSGAKVFNSTGITLALSSAARDSWSHAVRRAQALGVKVAFDLNFRPALSELKALWASVRPYLCSGMISLLVIKEKNLEELCGREQIPVPEAFSARRGPHPAREGRGRPSDWMPTALTLLQQLRKAVQVPAIACCFSESVRHGWVSRWSAVVSNVGQVSTHRCPVYHRPVEPLGGGDTWLAGFLDGVLDWDATAQVKAEQWLGAARRGDCLAALAQEQTGPCFVPRERLAAAERDSPSDGARTLLSKVAATQDALLQAVRGGLVAQLSPADEQCAVAACRSLSAAGVRCVELALPPGGSCSALRAATQAVGGGLLLGAGPVADAATAFRAADAGAAFLSTAGVIPEVIKAGHARGVPVIPGVATPTDADRAQRLGARSMWLSPAPTGGHSALLKALHPVFNKVSWLLLGCPSAAAAAALLQQPGVVACACPAVAPAELVEEGRWQELADAARAAVAAAAEGSPALGRPRL
eukprot:TRINITY_DN14155_c0_g1_i1.p1 TRINITY_DN14155_c0_g1~~TRINITY_DN14155_c0_g1_i1.p1  ORF type:complete len:596 (+),score=137.07 TRINITY_DN14155_c0_g1_i1:77-1864(+)